MPAYDAIIIGTGQAGPALARRMAGLGMQVAIVERGRFGGTCINTGCTPTKTLIEIAAFSRAEPAAVRHYHADTPLHNPGRRCNPNCPLSSAEKDTRNRAPIRCRECNRRFGKCGTLLCLSLRFREAKRGKQQNDTGRRGQTYLQKLAPRKTESINNAPMK